MVRNPAPYNLHVRSVTVELLGLSMATLSVTFRVTR